MSLESLVETNSILGPLVWISLDPANLTSAHQHLGKIVRVQVHKILQQRFLNQTLGEFHNQLRRARTIRKIIERRSRSQGVPAAIRGALQEYLGCLEAWGKGAQLELPSPQKVDMQTISSVELALWLQDEYTGCQSGAFRLADGSALLWHSEEDVEDEPGERFDQLRVVSFEIEGCQVFSFIYPDLLPGSAFNWRSDRFFQAVDALYLRPGAQRGNMLANVAVWVTLRLGAGVEPVEVIRALGPFTDGYALVTAHQKRGEVRVERIEFSGRDWLVTALAEEPGSWFYQTNIFSDSRSAVALANEDLAHPARPACLERIQRSPEEITGLVEREEPLRALWELLCSTSGDRFGYAHEDVKAHLALHLAGDGMKMWLSSGPGLPGRAADHTLIL